MQPLVTMNESPTIPAYILPETATALSSSPVYTPLVTPTIAPSSPVYVPPTSSLNPKSSLLRLSSLDFGPGTSGSIGGADYLFIGINSRSNNEYPAIAQPGVLILNIRNPDNPQQAAFLLASDQSMNIQGMELCGSSLYVFSTNSLWVVDVSDPSTPKTHSILPDVSPASLAVSGRYAYLSEKNNNRQLTIVDLADPSHPQAAGKFSMPATGPFRLKVSGSLLLAIPIVSTEPQASNGLYIIDISSPLALKQLSFLPDTASPSIGYIPVSSGSPPRTYDIPSAFYDMAISGNYVFVAASGPDGMQVVDVSAPASPRVIAHVPQTGAARIAISGNRAYLTSGGLSFVVDISDPRNPGNAAYFETSYQYSDFTVIGNHLCFFFNQSNDYLNPVVKIMKVGDLPQVALPVPTTPASIPATPVPTTITFKPNPAAAPVAASASKIVFVHKFHKIDGDDEIFIMNEDGTNQTRLTNNPARDFEPSLSPDGKKIVFTSDREGPYGIFYMNADGSQQTRMNDLEAWSPVWSPDGTRIAFSSAPKNRSEIFVMNADGSNPVPLTSIDGSQPQWSPDGKQIAFISSQTPGNLIYVMNADGSNQKRLTKNFSSEETPIWSPDGSQVVFSAFQNNNIDIYTMKIDGSQLIRLTQNEGEDKQPSWSPDGSRLAFVSDRAGSLEIWGMDTDGSNPVQFTHLADAFHPNYTPAYISARSVPLVASVFALSPPPFPAPPPPSTPPPPSPLPKIVPDVIGAWQFGKLIFGPGTTGVIGGQDYLFIGINNNATNRSHAETGIMILDIRNPDSPQQVSYLLAPDNNMDFKGMELSGNLLYVSAGNSLWIIDVSNPSKPREISRLSGIRAVGSAIMGNTVFVNDNQDRISLIDVSDPSHPRVTGDLELESLQSRPFVKALRSGALLFVITAGNANGLHIFDSRTLKELGFYALPNSTAPFPTFTDIAVAGRYAYLAATGQDGMRVLDISDPANPREVSRFPAVTSDIRVLGDLAFLQSGSQFGIVDVSIPANPRKIFGQQFQDSFSGSAQGDNRIYYMTHDFLQTISISPNQLDSNAR